MAIRLRAAFGFHTSGYLHQKSFIPYGPAEEFDYQCMFPTFHGLDILIFSSLETFTIGKKGSSSISCSSSSSSETQSLHPLSFGWLVWPISLSLEDRGDCSLFIAFIPFCSRSSSSRIRFLLRWRRSSSTSDCAWKARVVIRVYRSCLYYVDVWIVSTFINVNPT